MIPQDCPYSSAGERALEENRGWGSTKREFLDAIFSEVPVHKLESTREEYCFLKNPSVEGTVNSMEQKTLVEQISKNSIQSQKVDVPCCPIYIKALRKRYCCTNAALNLWVLKRTSDDLCYFFLMNSYSVPLLKTCQWTENPSREKERLL